MVERLEVAREGESVPARWYRAGSPGGAALVLGHGAGAGQASEWMVAMAEALAARGVDAITFDFPYMRAGRTLPDPGPRLESWYRAAAARIRAHEVLGTRRLFLGGKSMGGRIASMIVAAGEPAAGLVLLGYPLHPPRAPAKDRGAHFAAIRAPILIVQGARDVFGGEAALRAAFGRLDAPPELLIVPEGDHSFSVPRRLGRSRHEVLAEVADWVARFVAR